jgi:hypothetical protein
LASSEELLVLLLGGSLNSTSIFADSSLSPSPSFVCRDLSISPLIACSVKYP